MRFSLGEERRQPIARESKAMDTVVSESTRIFGTFLPNVIGALLILIVGWLVAMVVAAVVKGLLGRTDLDNRIARSMGAVGLAVENTIGRVVFWLIMLFVLVAFFQALNLAIVSEPLNQLLTQVTAFLPRLVSAAVLLLVAWVVATVLKRLVTGVLGRIGIDRRLGNMVDQDQRSPQASTAAAEPSAQPGERREAMPGGVSLSQSLARLSTGSSSCCFCRRS
jgi:small-conductance mechanosensitive channel